MSTAATQAPRPQRVHSTWNATVRTALGAAAAVTFILLAFLWPTRTSTMKDLPIDIVAKGPIGTRVELALADNGAFDIRHATTRDEATTHIKERQTYGAVVVDGSHVELLTAPPASPVAAQALQGAMAGFMQAQATQAAGAKQAAATTLAQAGARAAAATASQKTIAGIAAQAPAGPQKAALEAMAKGAQAKVLAAQADVTAAKAATDAVAIPAMKVTQVVALSPDDPRGAGMGVAALPLAMGGMIGGVMISTLLVGARRRFAASAGYGVLGGLALALVLGPWLDVLPGSYWHVALVIGSALFATAVTITGFNALLGKIGIPLGAVLTMFVGNPLSAASSPMELLPGPFGTLGQLLVPGASTTLLRNAAYFPDADPARPWLVLLAWAALGTACLFAGHFRDEEVVHIDGATEPDPA